MKRFNFNIKDRKILSVVFCLILIGIFTMTIAYAVLSVSLNVSGSAEVAASNWDIHFENINVISGSSGSVPTIKDNTTVNFTTTLNMPGDYYIFTVDIVNDGSIDAMIDEIIKTPELTTEQAKYITYVIEYANGDALSTKQLIESDSYVRIKVKVQYRRDLSASDLPNSSTTLNLSFKVNYMQAADTGTISVDNNGEVFKIVSGDLNTVGSEICIEKECFYIISSSEQNITMLAKYNLYVGGTLDDTDWVAYGDEATGIQNSSMIGVGTSVRKGVINFSNTYYWYSSAKNYPADVYDVNSKLYNYVETYKMYLLTLGVVPSVARLITYNELVILGCSASSNSCSGAPSWVYGTSYWTGTAYNPHFLYAVVSDSTFKNYQYGHTGSLGVRPVIVISKDYFN